MGDVVAGSPLRRLVARSDPRNATPLDPCGTRQKLFFRQNSGPGGNGAIMCETSTYVRDRIARGSIGPRSTPSATPSRRPPAEQRAADRMTSPEPLAVQPNLIRPPAMTGTNGCARFGGSPPSRLLPRAIRVAPSPERTNARYRGESTAEKENPTPGKSGHKSGSGHLIKFPLNRLSTLFCHPTTG